MPVGIFLYILIFSSVVVAGLIDRKYLKLHDLDLINGIRYTGLAASLRIRLAGAVLLLQIFLFSPIYSVRYPKILNLSETYCFGYIYAFVFISVFLSFVFSFLLSGREWLYKVNSSILRFLNNAWVIGLGKEKKTQYQRHGTWRWAVILMDLKRAWRVKQSPSVHFVRSLLVGLAFFVALFILEHMVDGLDFFSGEYPIFQYSNLTGTSQVFNSVLLVAGLPIVFFVWLFRDQNNLWTIENQRKDVNLKDFQKLAEWASGLHLPEDKMVFLKKTSKQEKRAGQAATEVVNAEESSSSQEFFSEPAQSSLKTHSRRDGAVALQISAIHQLQAFLRGDFGAHFKRPAFQLLKSIWLARVKLLLDEMEAICSTTERDWAAGFDEWNEKIRAEMSRGVGSALILSLGGENGSVLRDNFLDLPYISLPGFDGMLLALQKEKIHRNIELYDLNLRGIQWQGANLKVGHFQRCDLFSAQLQSANLQFSSLQGAQLAFSDLRYAKLDGAKMQGADLGSAKIFGASLMVADLRGTDFSSAILNSAKFNGASLEGAILVNIHIDDSTDFSSAKADSSTIVAVATPKEGVYGRRAYPTDYIVDAVKTKELIERVKKAGPLFYVMKC